MTDEKNTNRPKGIENQLKTSNPLSTGPLNSESLTDAILVQTKTELPTATTEPQPGSVEEVPISPKDQKALSLQRLTSQLAEVIHCNNRDDVSILQKVQN